MKTKFYQIVFVCLALVGITFAANAQTIPGSYDPFTTGNMSGFATKNVSENSIHEYTINGDANLTGSTFVFKVVGGTLITSLADDTPISPVVTYGAGTHAVSETANQGSVFVKWDDIQADNYVAVYEISSTNCITTDIIQGFKITVSSKPQVEIASADLDACSTDIIPIDITITNGVSPWTLTLNDGTADKTFYFSTDDVSAISSYDVVEQVVLGAGSDFTYAYSATGYLNTKVDGTDETYTFTVNQFDDAVTIVEPLDNGTIVTGTVSATVHPLPVVGTMVQN